MSEDRDGSASAAELLQTLDCLREGVQVLDSEWRYVYVNEAVARHGRRSAAELLGKTLFECYPSFVRTDVFPVLERCMRERRSEQLENEFVHENGEREWFELRIEPCQDGLIILSLDITERKRLDATVRQSHKLRALSQTAAAVAHDLKNMLNPLSFQLELLRRRLSEDQNSQEILNKMTAALRRGTEAVDLLRDIARQEPAPALLPIDLNAITRDAVQACRSRVAQHPAPIALREVLKASSPVRVSAPELLSALINLIVNAIDALPAGGWIAVRTGRARQGVRVEVEDNGIGMPPPLQARVFEPFFSTKEEAGTGLGLATVYAFVSRHGGTMRLRTRPGAGTTVTLIFPPAG
jgi:PAS domain S-box-containing protein